MSEDLRELFFRFRDHFINGQYRELTAYFTFPTVVFMTGRPMVMEDAPALEQAFRLYWQQRLEGTGFDIRPEVTVEPAGAGHRTPVFVEWIVTDAAGAELARTPVRYFVLTGQGRPKVEMLEFLALPDLPRPASAPPRQPRH